MDQSQVPNQKPRRGCGCGSGIVPNAKAATEPLSIDVENPLSEQQEKLISRIQKTFQRKNSIYKTNTRYFM